MANNPNHLDNLKKWEKGKSGNPNGRPKGFRKRYREIQDIENGFVWIPYDLAQIRINENDKKEVGFQLSKTDALICRLNELIETDNESVSLNAIKFIWEQVDGKATQPVEEITNVSIDDVEMSRLNEPQRNIFIKLLKISMGKIPNDGKL